MVFKTRPLYILLFPLIFALSCSYVTPEPENSDPGLELAETVGVSKKGTLSIRKTFFGIHTNVEEARVSIKLKKWLCGWAPVERSGLKKNYGGMHAAISDSGHCNMSFHISPDGGQLEARLLNVDYLKVQNDEYDHPLLFSIPIRSHYFFERDVNSRGRKENRYTKITDKENWKLAPYMDLDLKSIRFFDKMKKPGAETGGGVLNNVHSIEFEVKEGKNFLAFTGTHISGRYGNLIQEEMRFNFLEFQSNPNFKPTPYDISASKYMNILHILGGSPDGLNQIKYAAHWDLSQPIEVCLNNFPDTGLRDYKSIAAESLAEANRILRKIGALREDQKGFVVSKKEYAYDFDLRCPSINWVEDPRISLSAPLGVAMVNADYTNGEIKWGTSIIWGGLVENYIMNVNSPAISSTEDAFTGQGALDQLRNSMDTVDELAALPIEQWGQFINLVDAVELRSYSLGSHDLSSASKFEDSNLDYTGFSKENYIDYLKEKSPLTDYVGYSPEESLQKKLAQRSLTESVYDTKKFIPQLSKKQPSFVFDYENTLDKSFKTIATPGLNRFKAVKKSLKSTILHEFGHFLGLGHQFKANIMPKKGSVPENVYKRLQEKSHNHQNISSIMGYPNGAVTLNRDYENIRFHVQDELVFRYLYNQQVAVYKPGQKEFDQFADLALTGEITAQPWPDKPEYKTTYMPQCSDTDAYLSVDPYCRRWDRGYDAPTIVQENNTLYRNIFDSLTSSYTAATGGNIQRSMNRLWSRTYSTMNYNRAFYDQMRYLLSTKKRYSKAFEGISKNEDALYAFSEACINPSAAPEALQPKFALLSLEKISDINSQEESISELKARKELLDPFKALLGSRNIESMDQQELANFEEEVLKEEDLRFSEIQKLCRANKETLTLAKDILSVVGLDKPTVNYEDSLAPTGLRGANGTSDYSRLWGRYENLGVLPFKLPALDLLTSTSSTFNSGMFRAGKPKFNDAAKGGSTGFFSLYPKEFTDIVTATVSGGLSFSDQGSADYMSLVNLYLNHFLQRTFRLSHDSKANRFPDKFIKALTRQTKFDVKMVVVRLIPVKGEDETNISSFKAEIFNKEINEKYTLETPYVLEDKDVVLLGQKNQLLLPTTKIRFVSKELAYVYALDISFEDSKAEKIRNSETAKDVIFQSAENILRQCTSELNNHLKQDSFPGFTVKSQITKNGGQTEFEDSLIEAYKDFKYKDQCKLARRRFKLIFYAALGMNGYFLPEVFDYVQ